MVSIILFFDAPVFVDVFVDVRFTLLPAEYKVLADTIKKLLSHAIKSCSTWNNYYD